MAKKYMGNTGGYVPYSDHAEGAGHKKQPKGKSIGYGSERNWDQRPWGAGKGGSPSGEVANVGSGKRGSSLEGEKGFGHAKQPEGHSTGEGQDERHRLGEPYKFRQPEARGAYVFRGQGGLKQGALRLSGVKGAHQVGCRKK